MKGMIFAAGLGLRLRPLTDVIPKPLIPVGNIPLIAHTLSFLKRHGVDEVVINLHYHAGKIIDALGDGGRFGLRIIYSREETLLGTGGGLKRAERYLADGTFFLINSDIIADVDLGEVLAFHRENKALATMVLREDPEAESFGPIGVDRTGRIGRFLGVFPAAPGRGLRTCMFTGIHVLDPGVFAYIPGEGYSSITEAMYPALLRRGEPVFGYVSTGYWTDVGTPDRYERALKDAAAGRVKMFFDPAVSRPDTA